jgi:crossover junction endodeoxyribonuclease RuvC
MWERPAMNTSRTCRVVGIDPGLNVTGYGVVDFFAGSAEPLIVEAGTIRTDPKADTGRRIEQIHADLCALLAEMKPDRMGIEKLYAHYKHPRTAILMGHVRGVVLLAAQQAGIVVRNLEATKIKKSLTGNGHASKQQVQRAIQSLCNLPHLPAPPDVADALAIALCAERHG